jgi:hypothetical protein
MTHARSANRMANPAAKAGMKWLRRGIITLIVIAVLLYATYRFLIAQGAAFSMSL